MAIGSAQYDAIMREYDERRTQNNHIYESHKQEIYDFVDGYKEADDEIADLARESTVRALDGDKEALPKMKRRIDELIKKKKALLAASGYSEAFLQPVYTCPDCKDTGYIGDDKCHCLKREILRVMYRQSNIEDILKEENFDKLSFDYYADSEVEQMKKIVKECKDFVDDFDKEYGNILLYGDVGVGKTYLTNCMAKALLDLGHSVIYFTSYDLFDTLARYTFHRDEADAQIESVHKDIFDCDLLIIDDLGTENVNSFVSSQLFLILNERDKRKKSTIISTNLSLEKLNDVYSERSFSRIFGNYRLIKPDIADIRIKKRRQTQA